MDKATAVEEVRARLQELVPDFWTAAEVLRAVNEGVNRFAQEEKWLYLYTEGNVTVPADDETFELTGGVSFERQFNLLITFDGDERPRSVQRVSAVEGFRLRKTFYRSQSEPLAFYLASEEAIGTNEVQSVANTGSTTGNFTLTFDGQTTTNIARGATAATVKARLIALSNIGPADVWTSGGPLGTAPVKVHFVNNLGGADVPLMTLGGTTTSIAVTEFIKGGEGTGSFVSTVRLVPPMNRIATIEYQYIRDPVEVVNDSDALDIPDEYVMGAIAYATGHLFLKELQFSNKADEQFALYRKSVDDAKREMRKLSMDKGFGWGRNQPEYRNVSVDEYVELVTPPLLGP